jgi:hypothetical protein
MTNHGMAEDRNLNTVSILIFACKLKGDQKSYLEKTEIKTVNTPRNYRTRHWSRRHNLLGGLEFIIPGSLCVYSTFGAAAAQLCSWAWTVFSYNVSKMEFHNNH